MLWLMLAPHSTPKVDPGLHKVHVNDFCNAETEDLTSLTEDQLPDNASSEDDFFIESFSMHSGPSIKRIPESRAK